MSINININKKTQYQIQKLQSSLDNYNKKLLELETIRNNLLLHSITSLESTITNSDTIIELNKQKTYLELQIKSLKLTLITTQNLILQTNEESKNLIGIYYVNIANEQQIYNDEIDRINTQIIVCKESHKECIELSKLDKDKLDEDIKILKETLDIQSSTILELQIYTHTTRKNILTELHNKKKDKTIIQKNIDSNNQTEQSFSNQISQLQQSISNLNEFKSMLIDIEYSVNSITNTNTNTNTLLSDNSKLTDYYIEFNMNDSSIIELSLTDKLIIIDSKLEDYQKTNQLLIRKLDKFKLVSSSRLKAVLNNYNTVSRIKAMGYKDIYKIEKNKKYDIEQTLHSKLAYQNTYDNIVIANIDNILQNALLELKIDSINSKERLDIMLERILQKFDTDKARCKTSIDDYNINIKDIIVSINDISNELIINKEAIANENIIESQIQKIDIDIAKYNIIITQITNDIKQLNN